MPDLLLVEDDPALGSLLAEDLDAAGYTCTWAPTLADARLVLGRDPVCLVLLDLMLPDGSGFDLLQEIRARSEVPVIVLTARTFSEDKVQGLDLGADDYVTKPFWTEELLARIRARLRRTAPAEARRGFGDVRVFTEARRVEVGGEDVRLTPTEYALLDTLLRQQGKAVRREELARASLEDGDSPDNLQAHVSRLRKKLGPDGAWIRTVWGIGYRLDVP